MREILFRGYSKLLERWVYGSLVNEFEDGSTIHFHDSSSPGFATVDPKSIGQYTGIKDKNRAEIYEGDVLTNGSGRVRSVYYHQSGFYINDFNHIGERVPLLDATNIEVIGNIYINPEMKQ